jgi:hypothetical protein
VTDQLAEVEPKRRWFTTEQTERLRAARPEQQLGQRVRDAACELEQLSPT